MSASLPPIETALNRWRSNLIDLSRRNPLLSLKPTSSTYLTVVQPALTEVFEQLVRGGKPAHFHLPAEGNKKAKEPARPKPGELVTTETERERLLQVLTNLYRRALADFNERGLHILYLALGVLEWRDGDDQPARSPLLLLPVELKRNTLRDPFILHAIEGEDLLVNPALAARLRQDFDFRLPDAPADWDEANPATYLDQVGTAIGGLPGWAVQPEVVLSLFSFSKGVIFQDLQENAERVAAHPLVQALAGLPVGLPRAEPPGESELDGHDPRAAFHVLDADGSQRLCLETAARGESFVLIGPPGTGKSQTIANLIADHIARGQKVLFVSDKMAALEVVDRRLREVGLGDYCLELHSHKTSKRAVVTELARCLSERWATVGHVANVPQIAGHAGNVPHDEDAFAKLQKRRDQLNGYTHALHQVREPMRRSAWDALAELPRYRDVPLVPLGLPAVRPEGDDATRLALSEFTPAHLDELMGHLRKLQGLWHIRTEADFPWRGFKADRYNLQLRDEVVALIDRIRGRGDKLRAAADQYGKQLGVSGSVAGLLKLGDLLERRPAHVEAAWLSELDLAALAADLERCADQYQRLAQARKPLTDRYGAALWLLPEGAAARVESAWKSAAALLSPDDERGAAFLAQQQKLRAWAADTQKRVPAWLTELRTLDKWLLLPLPVGAGASPGTTGDGKLDPSAEDVRHFARLVTLCQTNHPAERRWLDETQTLAGALELTGAARTAGAGYRQRHHALMQHYTEDLFALDLPKMAAGFEGPYRTWVRFFRRGYWRACSALTRVSRAGMLPRTASTDVVLARDALAERRVVEAEMAKRPGALGRYDKGLESDLDAADNAAKLTVEAIELAQSLGHATMPTKLGDALVSGAPPEKIRAALKRLNESLAGWWHLTEELHGVLPMAQLPGVGARLEECALSALVHYAKDVQAALNLFAGLTDAVLRQAAPADMPALVLDLKKAEEVRAFEASQQSEAQRWATRFGPAFQGVGTDWDALRKTLTWTRRVRECLSFGAQFIEQAAGTPPAARELRQALEQYEQALHHLEIRFDAPGPVLAGKPLREHGPDEVLDHLQKLRDRVGALSDWVDWRHLPERFQHLGLGPFWERLIDATVARTQVVDVFLKAFWSAWLDAVFQRDEALAGFRRPAHEQALAEFRALDRRILQLGAARVAGRLNGAPPAEDSPEVKLLLREANKKAKHLPLRRLFDEMPSLVAWLKPCLLMSPLSVSQFLPADPLKLQFDVVVFDEASQLLPEDAIAAIYRGKQTVVTGDNQQLPPTTFFQQLAGESELNESDDEPLFESVLDACLAAGLPRRTLRWHYRSRHEGLIAFSNETFYDGKLVTFPSPRRGDAGVRMHAVQDGVYDRGGRRDNPREAQEVARLVLEHVRKTPEKTLGVIALSYAQMNAIEDELDRQLRDHPELERHFQGDRLGGFFVKNLETVQGDERDMIFLSVGYGPDRDGKLVLNFGPLNRAGGERRLNVAVTRAREELVVVSTLRAGDLDLAQSASVGLTHLRRYLDFAERGIDALTAAANVALPSSPLHDDVQHELKKHGYETVAHVGCGSYRLDLGVLDPANPNTFVAGIAFDGPAYAQTATARDRDRLRPEVLARLGWRLHRIWAADWLHRRDEEVQRLLQALASVPAALSSRAAEPGATHG
jgi:hypothetical protein